MMRSDLIAAVTNAGRQWQCSFDSIGIPVLVDWARTSLKFKITPKCSSASVPRMMLQRKGALKMSAVSVGKTASRCGSGKVMSVSGCNLCVG